MKTEQRIEELLTEVESVNPSEVGIEEFIKTFADNTLEVNFLHLKELYRLGNSPADCKQIISDDINQSEMAPLLKLCHEKACEAFDMWLAQ